MFKKVKFSTLAIFTVVLWIGVYLVADLRNKTQGDVSNSIYSIVLAVFSVAGLAGAVIVLLKYLNGDRFLEDE